MCRQAMATLVLLIRASENHKTTIYMPTLAVEICISCINEIIARNGTVEVALDGEVPRPRVSRRNAHFVEDEG
jgi:hypothetical protein